MTSGHKTAFWTMVVTFAVLVFQMMLSEALAQKAAAAREPLSFRSLSFTSSMHTELVFADSSPIDPRLHRLGAVLFRHAEATSRGACIRVQAAWRIFAATLLARATRRTQGPVERPSD